MATSAGIAYDALTALRPPSVGGCVAAIACVKIALRVLGLKRTLRAIRRLASPTRAIHTVPRAVVDEVGRRVAMAAAIFPARAACLEQSLVLYGALLAMRVPAAFRVGAQPVNFAAHAWVEYLGEPVLEGELVRTIIPFPELPV